MDNCFGQHGWREFHRNRKDILAEFDKLIEQTKSRPIQVAHGQAVEAYLRKWLGEFLPKKYAVTSGYIIPNLYDDSGKTYHYDIIIYNCLEAPILWTEGNFDDSEQGKFRAIPAKYVCAVYEVKSRLTKSNVDEALQKLDQTKNFKEQLHANYSCGAIFIDLKEIDNQKSSILEALSNGSNIHGFWGGIVLRYESDDSATGLFSFFNSDKDEKTNKRTSKPLAKAIDSMNIYMTEDGNVVMSENGSGATLVCTDNNTWSVSKSYNAIYRNDDLAINLSWSRSNFSEFCIHLLSSLDGMSYNDKERPSFGRVFDKIERKKAAEQPDTPLPGQPFIKMSFVSEGENEEKYRIDYEENVCFVHFWVEVENTGVAEAIISDDGFKSTCSLPAGKNAVKPCKVALTAKEGDGLKNDIEGLLSDEGEGLVLPYRVVYYIADGEKVFYSVENQIKLHSSSIEVL